MDFSIEHKLHLIRASLRYRICFRLLKFDHENFFNIIQHHQNFFGSCCFVSFFGSFRSYVTK